MDFTYIGYSELIAKLREQGYAIANYHTYKETDRCVILRHDVDNDLEKAAQLAEFEQSLGIRSTYFLLLTSDFYNVFSKESEQLLKQIQGGHHDIGLHFDEARYPEASGDPQAVTDKILYEAGILSMAVGTQVSAVSMHRPSRAILDADIHIPDMINSYGKKFFREFKYLSDSRRHWQEPVEEIIDSAEYDRLHILTHPFWYSEKEYDMHRAVAGFINSANLQRYQQMERNITDLESIMGREEVL